jgi:hypothetical protein
LDVGAGNQENASHNLHVTHIQISRNSIVKN